MFTLPRHGPLPAESGRAAAESTPNCSFSAQPHPQSSLKPHYRPASHSRGDPPRWGGGAGRRPPPSLAFLKPHGSQPWFHGECPAPQPVKTPPVAVWPAARGTRVLGVCTFPPNLRGLWPWRRWPFWGVALARGGSARRGQSGCHTGWGSCRQVVGRGGRYRLILKRGSTRSAFSAPGTPLRTEAGAPRLRRKPHEGCRRGAAPRANPVTRRPGACRGAGGRGPGANATPLGRRWLYLDAAPPPTWIRPLAAPAPPDRPSPRVHTEHPQGVSPAAVELLPRPPRRTRSRRPLSGLGVARRPPHTRSPRPLAFLGTRPRPPAPPLPEAADDPQTPLPAPGADLGPSPAVTPRPPAPGSARTPGGENSQNA